MNLNDFKNVYFIGVGGIGMSALARYFNASGWSVYGYDKTQSELTTKLQEEGIKIHFCDEPSFFLNEGLTSLDTLVIITPAVPQNLGELVFVQKEGFQVMKRAAVLGAITRISKGLGVAGTHGKTTTSTLLAHILNESTFGCTAFLGGISANFQSNLLINQDAEYTVIEADEFDRSFLQLSPFASIITSCDPDHLDIYGDEEHFLEGFRSYAQLIQKEGCCIQKYGLNLSTRSKTFSYSVDFPEADFFGTNLRVSDEAFQMDIHFEGRIYSSVVLGLPGKHNAENALACFALCIKLGLDENAIRNGLASFKGVKRRFEYHIKDHKLVYIDDYAHHPTELEALVDSLELLYPNRRIVGVFQPHLFSRTKDFMEGFVKQLSRFDEVIVMPIYPARELPIEGVTSEVIVSQIGGNATVLDPKGVLDYFEKNEVDVVVTAGAGDIDRIVKPLSVVLHEKLG